MSGENLASFATGFRGGDLNWLRRIAVIDDGCGIHPDDHVRKTSSITTILISSPPALYQFAPLVDRTALTGMPLRRPIPS